MRAIGRAIATHREHWGEPTLVVRAPGRVNLIGEHTDYNDGFVLPMALPFDTVVAVSTTDTARRIEVRSEGYGVTGFSATRAAEGGSDWSLHLRAVVQLLSDAGIVTDGWRATIASDVPTGAGLSSSAAVQVATARAVLALTDNEWAPTAVARLCRRADNEIVGIPSGIMDQLISAAAVDAHATLIDCRSLELTTHPVPTGCSVVVMDTGSRRELVGSEYADRQRECARAAALLGVGSLREIDSVESLAKAGSVEMRRARHVVSENRRTLDAADALDLGDAARVGRLMVESHVSLRDDYEVSGPELDAIVEAALASTGCLGARMTGGGFAGCAVALVETAEVDGFEATVSSKYRAATGLEATLWVCRPAAGAEVVRAD